MNNAVKGFTLVELMVTVVVVAIVAAIALPSLSAFYERSRADSEISKIREALKLARNQAFSYGATVGVCAYGTSDCGTNWNKGLRVYLLKPDNSQETLKLIEGFHSNDTVKGVSITFTSNGLASEAATYIYCPGGKTDYSRSVELSVTGIIKNAADGKSCT
ncbi:GspH/FimT family pseudopilin [Shewanella cyperi]|uniref:GspH/FimT family pseudopilin n=1 Tax=Shewanella cyperi TaxID=2814292 RepID=UPI001A93B276|nr:GspH/FimT family protein [Shewanella cyperi]QSX41652.1 GspH/FimT family protein [Shewanella cyperi]